MDTKWSCKSYQYTLAHKLSDVNVLLIENMHR